MYLISRLEQVEVKIESVKKKVDFEFIKIMDDSNPSFALLGIYWAFDNNVCVEFEEEENLFRHKYPVRSNTIGSI